MRRTLFVSIGLLFPFPAHAIRITAYWNCAGFWKCGQSQNAVADLTLNLINGVGNFIIALAIVACFYGAIRMIVSQGQEGKEAGKKAVMWALLGLVAALLTSAIISFIWDYLYVLGG